MTWKKQIILPFIMLAIGVSGFFIFQSMKKPPEEKEPVDNTPIVAIDTINIQPLTLRVDSYGVVEPKYETQLIAQVSGQIVELDDVFVRGGFIKKGQLLARIDPNDYQAALIDAQANMASARASLEMERAQGKVAEREWQQIANTSPTELSLRKPQLAKELARVKAAQAAELRAKRNLERTEIRAPYDAMIASRNIGLGSFVNTGSMIGHLLGTDIAQIRLPVADHQLQYLKNQGQSARVKVFGELSGEKQVWSATIARSEGVVDSKSRMTYLVAEIKDPYALMAKNQQAPIRFGSYVTVDILGRVIEQATVIPQHLLVNNHVAILKNNTLHYAKVEVIRYQDKNVVVTEGLSQGDQLIISALDYPLEGMKLALTKQEQRQQEKRQQADNNTDTANTKE